MAVQPIRPVEVVMARAEKQWLFTDDEIKNSPSVRNGMTQKEEDELRRKAINFINAVGISLKLPQLTLYTGHIFLNRFFMRHSLKPVKDKPKPLHHYQIAAVALFIAMKVDENSRKTRDFVIACARTALKKPEAQIDEQTKDFWRWRDSILQNEDVLYEALCFDFTIESPHRLMVDTIKDLHVEHHKTLRKTAWTFVNDSMLTTLGLRYTHREIAATAIYAAARLCDLDPWDPTKELPLDPPETAHNQDASTETGTNGNGHSSKSAGWWESMNVSVETLIDACHRMADMYEEVKQANADGEPNVYARLRTPSDDGRLTGRTNGGFSEGGGSTVESRGIKRASDGTPVVQSQTPLPSQGADAERTHISDEQGSEEGEVDE